MKNIKLIVLDVDGTLTDGKIYYDNQGNEMKAFNAKDGMAISQAGKNGIDIAIITGRKSKIVEKRASELGIKYIFQGVNDKLDVLNKLLKKISISLENVMYIGDDINDIKVMNSVKICACPADAVEEVKKISDLISVKNGGEGAVREIIEIVLKSQNKWISIVKKYSGGNQ